MTALLLSIVALLAGPLLYRGARPRRAASVVDGFALVGVGGLVLLEVLPQSFASLGWWALLLAVLGLAGPGLLCGSRALGERGVRRVALPLAFLALAVHALLDGVALATEGEAGRNLAIAVVLHRLPVGVGIWWLVVPVFGTRVAAGLLGVIAAATVAGFASGGALLGIAPQAAVAGVQAFLGGSLLHVLLRHPPEVRGADAAARARAGSAVGALLAAGLLVALRAMHDGAAHVGETVAAERAGDTFLELAFESAPALLLAHAIVALAHAWMGDVYRLLRGGTRLGQAARGTLVGLPVPVCSCGVVPLYRGLVASRVPPPAAIAFLVATPELGAAAIFLSWSLLGPWVTAARAGAAIVLALVAGVVVGGRAALRARAAAAGPGDAPPGIESRGLPLPARLRAGARFGFVDMVDDTAPWILVGLALAAVATPLLHAEGLAALPSFAQVPLFALVGMPVYVCASGSTPLVAVLLAKGTSVGAAIAFLLTGPATNVTTFGVLARLHGRRIALLFAGLVALLAVAIGWTVDAVLPSAAAAAVPPLGEEGPTPLQVASLVLLGLLYAASLVRQGMRGFLGQVIEPHGHVEEECADERGEAAAAGQPAR